MYKLFLTFRYLTRRVLTLVAVLAIAGAIAVLVVAPAIMAGFQEEFHARLRGTLSDLTVWGSQPFSLPDDPELERYFRLLTRAVVRVGELPRIVLHVRNSAIDLVHEHVTPVAEDVAEVIDLTLGHKWFPSLDLVWLEVEPPSV